MLESRRSTQLKKSRNQCRIPAKSRNPNRSRRASKMISERMRASGQMNNGASLQGNDRRIKATRVSTIT